jgi:uncharacterized protein (DUF1015 family)
MATIKPFIAFQPNPLFADKLVFTSSQTESVSGDLEKSEALPPLKVLLETIARQRPETPDGQAAAYHTINQTFQNLLETDQFWEEEKPGLYVYEVVHKNYRQTGLWTMTALEDYTNGKIKTHELTFADSVRRIKNYRKYTGLEGSPVLITYPPHKTIDRIITETKSNAKKITLGNSMGLHRIWKIESQETITQLTDAFAEIDRVYVADGHHRLESAHLLAMEQAESKMPVFGYLSSLYIASDQLRIFEYDRMVLPEHPYDKTELLKQVAENFHIQASAGNHYVQPREVNKIGMCIAGQWFHLLSKAKNHSKKGMEEHLDVDILQDELLKPVFGISDPAIDTRLKYFGGEQALEELHILLEQNPHAIAFTLSPLTVQQLIDAADQGRILPPKSTWIYPKVPYGLLMYKHALLLV